MTWIVFRSALSVGVIADSSSGITVYPLAFSQAVSEKQLVGSAGPILDNGGGLRKRCAQSIFGAVMRKRAIKK